MIKDANDHIELWSRGEPDEQDKWRIDGLTAEISALENVKYYLKYKKHWRPHLNKK